MSAKELLSLHDDLCSAAKALMTRKNHDYTSGSGDPFANFRGSSYLGIDPILGVMLRMQDKMMRIRTFTEKGELKVKDESVKDALVDLINYTVLMYGLLQEERASPGPEPEGNASGTLVRSDELRQQREYAKSQGAKPVTPNYQLGYHIDGRVL